jgi:hypothetical protein
MNNPTYFNHLIYLFNDFRNLDNFFISKENIHCYIYFSKNLNLFIFIIKSIFNQILFKIINLIYIVHF